MRRGCIAWLVGAAADRLHGEVVEVEVVDGDGVEVDGEELLRSLQRSYLRYLLHLLTSLGSL